MQAIQSQPLDLNILPERYRSRPVAASTVLLVTVAAILLIGLVPAYDLVADAQVQTTQLKARLLTAQTTLAQTQSEQAQLEQQLQETTQQIEQAHTQIARLRAELSALSQQRTSRSAGVAAAVAALVPRVHIATIAQQEDSFVLTGQAGSQGLVLDYARALQASGQFTNVRILSMVNADLLGLIPDINFSIETEQ